MEGKRLGDFSQEEQRVCGEPYNAEFPVICMDESPKQLIEEANPSVAMKPGQDARVDYEYVRHGVVNIFMANEPLMGKR